MNSGQRLPFFGKGFERHQAPSLDRRQAHQRAGAWGAEICFASQQHASLSLEAAATTTLSFLSSCLQALTDELYQVSTPGSPKYGQHLTHEEVNRLVAPKPADVRAVMQWLSDHG